MWQLFALASLLSTALQSVADKWAIVHDRKIEASVATFWRIGLLFLFSLVVGKIGWLGSITWYFDIWIFIFALATAVSGFCYTYMLRKIEVTGIQAETYLMPLLFLGVDAVLLRLPLTAAQIAGVILLAFGGFALTIDGKTRRLKREFSPVVWGVFLYWIFYNGLEYYLFKYENSFNGVSSVSFFTSSFFLVTVLLLLIVVMRGKYVQLFDVHSTRYLPAVAVSKIFDTAASLLWLTALTYAAVSQVTALGALEPLFLLCAAIVVQKLTRFNIRERVDSANFKWKVFAITLLCAGTLLVS